MLATFRNFLRDRKGAAAAEYALLLAIVAAGVAIAAFNVGEAVDTGLTNVDTCLDDINSSPASITATECGNSNSD